MNLKLTPEQLANEREFLKEFNILCNKYGFYDRVRVITELFGLDVELKINIKNGKFIASKMNFKNGTENYRVLAKGEIEHIVPTDESRIDDVTDRLNLRITIGQYNQSLTLDNRRNKLEEYRKQQDFNITEMSYDNEF